MQMQEIIAQWANHIPWPIVLEVIGWGATVLFISSFLVKKPSLLHLLGFTACIFKMIYSYQYHVWPLFVNWVLLFFIEIVQWWRYRKDAESANKPHPIDNLGY